MNAYRAPRWLPGGHAQTVYPLLIKPTPYAYFRERWDTPDGDFIDIDWNRTERRCGDTSAAPLVILFHGLEGSSNSHYALSLMQELDAIGWGGAVVHFRGCSGEPNRLPRAYHSGDSAEIDWILRRVKARHPTRTCFAAGVSLGGNVLLKWLGERGGAAEIVVQAAAAVSTPHDLAACSYHLEKGVNRVYTRNFLQTMVPAAQERLRRFPTLYDGARLAGVRSLFDFDDAVTAPLHGFAGAEDYWRRSSCKPWLRAIGVPTLVLNAINDPFIPTRSLPRTDEVSASVQLEYPSGGGHAGFVSGSLPGNLSWMPRRLIRFFRDQC